MGLVTCKHCSARLITVWFLFQLSLFKNYIMYYVKKWLQPGLVIFSPIFSTTSPICPQTPTSIGARTIVTDTIFRVNSQTLLPGGSAKNTQANIELPAALAIIFWKGCLFPMLIFIFSPAKAFLVWTLTYLHTVTWSLQSSKDEDPDLGSWSIPEWQLLFTVLR